MLTAAIAGAVDHPCIKHATPEMTLRYAHLASDTIRDAYDTAIAKTRLRARLVAGSTAASFPTASSGSAANSSRPA
jgi:hypothetical protein